ncbi:MAG: alpha/beta hydrolase family protein [Micromonosporaceae bacterium]
MSDPREVLTRRAPGPAHTVRYGSHPDHVADVWLPDTATRPNGPTPFVLFVHGGFWRAAYDRMHVRPLCNDLVARGYAVASVEYRRVGQPGGAWPGSFDDLALAFDTVPALVGDLTSGELAPPVLAGHSAGGHVALWGAVRHRLPDGAQWQLPEAPVITGVLALAPVADLADAYRRGLGAGATAELLGGGPEEFPARYAATDPGTLPPPEAPAVLVHGSLDDRVPVDQSRRYADRPAAGQRPGPRLFELPDVEHFGVIDPLSAAWPAVVVALADLAPRS